MPGRKMKKQWACECWRLTMKTIEMDIYRKYKEENEELKLEIGELKRSNRELEERLRDLHGEYMWLYYQLEGMPSHTEILKVRQEMQTLMKESRMGMCHCNKNR
jgi:predicted nuclease with TOPRIM domain